MLFLFLSSDSCHKKMLLESVNIPLSSEPKIGIFHSVLEMLRRGQNCVFFCHIESHGNNKM